MMNLAGLAAIAGVVSKGAREVQAGMNRDAMAAEAARRFAALGTPESQRMAQFILEEPGAATAWAQEFGGWGKLYDHHYQVAKRDDFTRNLRGLVEGGLDKEEKDLAIVSALESGIDPRHLSELSAFSNDLGGWMKQLSPNFWDPQSIVDAQAAYDETGDYATSARLLRRLPPQKGEGGEKSKGPTAAQQADAAEVRAAREYVAGVLAEGADPKAMHGASKGGRFASFDEQKRDPHFASQWAKARQAIVGEDPAAYQAWLRQMDKWWGGGEKPKAKDAPPPPAAKAAPAPSEEDAAAEAKEFLRRKGLGG